MTQVGTGPVAVVGYLKKGNVLGLIGVFITFAGPRIYCTATSGFRLGVVLGWPPDIIGAFADRPLNAPLTIGPALISLKKNKFELLAWRYRNTAVQIELRQFCHVVSWSNVTIT